MENNKFVPNEMFLVFYTFRSSIYNNKKELDELTRKPMSFTFSSFSSAISRGGSKFGLVGMKNPVISGYIGGLAKLPIKSYELTNRIVCYC